MPYYMLCWNIAYIKGPENVSTEEAMSKNIRSASLIQRVVNSSNSLPTDIVNAN